MVLVLPLSIRYRAPGHGTSGSILHADDMAAAFFRSIKVEVEDSSSIICLPIRVVTVIACCLLKGIHARVDDPLLFELAQWTGIRLDTLQGRLRDQTWCGRGECGYFEGNRSKSISGRQGVYGFCRESHRISQ